MLTIRAASVLHPTGLCGRLLVGKTDGASLGQRLHSDRGRPFPAERVPWAPGRHSRLGDCPQRTPHFRFRPCSIAHLEGPQCPETADQQGTVEAKTCPATQIRSHTAVAARRSCPGHSLELCRVLHVPGFQLGELAHIPVSTACPVRGVACLQPLLDPAHTLLGREAVLSEACRAWRCRSRTVARGGVRCQCLEPSWGGQAVHRVIRAQKLHRQRLSDHPPGSTTTQTRSARMPGS